MALYTSNGQILGYNGIWNCETCPCQAATCPEDCAECGDLNVVFSGITDDYVVCYNGHNFTLILNEYFGACAFWNDEMPSCPPCVFNPISLGLSCMPEFEGKPAYWGLHLTTDCFDGETGRGVYSYLLELPITGPCPIGTFTCYDPPGCGVTAVVS